MKKFISMFLIGVLMIAVLCPFASAVDISSDDSFMDFMPAAVSYFYLYPNGVLHLVPTTTIVGYNHTTTGIYVGTLQKCLNQCATKYGMNQCDVGAVDQIFGQKTWQGVYNFQDSTHLATDGICGYNTWANLTLYNNNL